MREQIERQAPGTGPAGRPQSVSQPGTERSDRALLAAARSDPDAFGELYRRHVDRVVSFAARRVATPADVADLVAATFLAALESAGAYDQRR